jgi:hypothetical protein
MESGRPPPFDTTYHHIAQWSKNVRPVHWIPGSGRQWTDAAARGSNAASSATFVATLLSVPVILAITRSLAS